MKKELKDKMISLQKKAIKELGENNDLLITAFDNGHCGSIMHGATQNIAHSIFALIHDPKNKMSMELYRIVKLVVLNIVNNESPYAADLLTSILNTPGPQEDTKKQKTKIIKMKTNGKQN